MIRVIKTSFSATKETINLLFACNRISAQIWNESLRIAKEYALANNGEWINQSKLFKSLKKRYPMHSQSVQSVAKRYLFARDSAKKARLKGYKNKYPWRFKTNYNTRWEDEAFSFDFEKNQMALSFGVWNHKQQGISVELPKEIVEKIREILSKNPDAISQIELCYCNELKFHITYDDGEAEKLNNFTQSAGLDLGEIHAITACAENGNSVIITGRKLRSIHRLRNKLISKIQKAQSKCKKDSRRWKELQRKKRYILSKSRHQVENKTHEITKNFVDWCVENEIKHVFCGNPEGVQRNTSGRKKKNRTQNKKKIRKKKVSQKLSNWNFGKMMEILEYKLNAQNIKFEKINEAYTSQTCPNCGQRHKTSNRNYRCSCGYHVHRDVVGAHNILSLGKLGRFEKICNFEEQTPKYLRLTA